LYGYVGNIITRLIDRLGYAPPGNTCPDLLKKIIKAIFEYQNDLRAFYERNGYVDSGHWKELNNRWIHLENLLKKYDTKKCPKTDIPPIPHDPETARIECSDKPLPDETWKLCIPLIQFPVPDFGPSLEWCKNLRFGIPQIGYVVHNIF